MGGRLGGEGLRGSDLLAEVERWVRGDGSVSFVMFFFCSKFWQCHPQSVATKH